MSLRVRTETMFSKSLDHHNTSKIELLQQMITNLDTDDIIIALFLFCVFRNVYLVSEKGTFLFLLELCQIFTNFKNLWS